MESKDYLKTLKLLLLILNKSNFVNTMISKSLVPLYPLKGLCFGKCWLLFTEDPIHYSNN